MFALVGMYLPSCLNGNQENSACRQPDFMDNVFYIFGVNGVDSFLLVHFRSVLGTNHDVNQ